MAQLEENLKLGLEAVKYAKGQVRRSGNQHYYKSMTPFKDVKRNEFLLSATRGGSWIGDLNDKGEIFYTKDNLMSQRRKEIEQIIASSDPQSVKDKKIDKCIKDWGKDYFSGWDLLSRPGKDGQYNSRWQTLNGPEQIRKMAKKTGYDPQDIYDAAVDGDQTQWNEMYNFFVTKVHSDNAKKFGTGNCGEKAEVAALYLLDRTPGGLRISLYQLDPKHKGVTGIVTGAGGDHAFCVLGHNTVAADIGSLGPNAIIVDGWMNDAYPAQKYLSLKHGLNYNNERINIKQHTTRSMVCCSYRSHIQCFRDFGIPPAGPGTIPRPTLSRTKF
jgi:hypothetical protein